MTSYVRYQELTTSTIRTQSTGYQINDSQIKILFVRREMMPKMHQFKYSSIFDDTGVPEDDKQFFKRDFLT